MFLKSWLCYELMLRKISDYVTCQTFPIAGITLRLLHTTIVVKTYHVATS